MPQTSNLGLLIHETARLLRRHFESRSAHLGLPSGQWRVLVRLMRGGPASQARLAEVLEIEPISVSRLVDRMVQGGWVTRETDPADRRVRLVVPTPQAVRAFDGLHGIADGIIDEALAGISPADRATLIAALVAIQSNLSAAPADPAGPASPTCPADEITP